jgi:hypothetical protein
MRYREFRDQLQMALHEEGMFGQRIDNPTETIDLENMERSWKVYIARSSSVDTEPFHVSATITFNWGAIDTARSYTCEEDLLTELLGQKRSSSKTKPRYVRVDLKLNAHLPYGSTSVIPDVQTFGSWADTIRRKLELEFQEIKRRGEQLVAVIGVLEEIRIESRCDSTGKMSMAGLSVSGFRMVRVPRVWDDSERNNAEKGALTELAMLSKKFKYSLEEWTTGIGELARWIRYTPPPENLKEIEPFFDEQGDEEEGGTETIH